jgi:hypothetical protein
MTCYVVKFDTRNVSVNSVFAVVIVSVIAVSSFADDGALADGCVTKQSHTKFVMFVSIPPGDPDESIIALMSVFRLALVIAMISIS